MTTTIDTTNFVNKIDLNFDQTLSHITEHFERACGKSPRLFMVDVSGNEVWDVFQTTLREIAGEEAAQHLNCSACKEVVRKIGNVVAVSELGQTIPVLWPYGIDDTVLGKVYGDVYQFVSEAKIVSLWMSDTPDIGVPCTTSKSGHEWTHLHVTLPDYAVPQLRSVDNASQVMANSVERYRILMNGDTGISRIKMETLDLVVRLLEADELYRSDHFLASAKFHQSVKSAMVGRTFSRALLWRNLVMAPDGWANTNSTMIGQLYESVESGLSLDEIKVVWNKRVDPDRFQRAQSKPSNGEITRAEVIIQKLEAQTALERRFAKLEDVITIWSPKAPDPKDDVVKGGIFSSLKSTPQSVSLSDRFLLTPKNIDWEKFKETILPTADRLQFRVPAQGGFAALLTAVHADAAPIFQWDKENDRYPVSWYTYTEPRPAQQWKLVPATFVDITGISDLPGFNDLHALLLDGCVDQATNQGLALFTEMLRPEFHEIRKTIEAFSNEGKLVGHDEASACGWLLGRNTVGITIRVITGKDKRDYIIDRMD